MLKLCTTHTSRSGWLAAALVAGSLLAAPVAHADDLTPLLGGGVGAAAGAVLGQSVGGKNGAVIGGALGGAAGAAVTNHGRNQNGAVIGGAVGGAAGAAVGQSVGGRSGAVVGAGLGGAAGTGIARNMGGREPQRYDIRGRGHDDYGYRTSYRGDDEHYRHGWEREHRHHGRGHGYARGHDRFED